MYGKASVNFSKNLGLVLDTLTVMEVCRLCLDLLHDNNFSSVDEPSKAIINMVAPEVNFEISSNPVLCKQCSGSIDEMHKFKIKLIENEKRIKQKCNGESDDQLSLKEILYGVNLGEIVVTEKAKERICRTCLDSIDGESFTVLKPSKPDAYLDSMITMCLPELDLELSRDPVMCEKCLSYLQKLHQLKTSCLDIEEKIKNYCTNHGTNSSAQINLHNVLETLVDNKKDQLEYVAIKTEIKTEKMNDDDGEINDREIKTEKDTHILLQGVKEEDMDIKTEESLNYYRTRRIPRRTSEHLGIEEIEAGNFYCDLCGKIFSTIWNMERHKLIHSGEKKFECHQCHSRYGQKSILEKHIRSHHMGERPFECDLCGKFFSTIWNMERHKMIHTGEKRYECNECHTRYAHKSILEKHVRSRHTGERPFHCDLCPKSFAAKSNLNSHIKTHQGIRPYTCGICGHQFSQKSNLKKHIVGHSGEKTIECNVCHKMFSTKYNLQSHMEVHNGEKPYFCDICYESFRHATPLQVHRMIHFGKRPYTCNTCGMNFLHQSGLTVHEKTHSGDKPFACPVCGKRFVKESIVASHLTLHTGDKQFECFMCGRRYADKSKLNYHLKKKCLKGISMSIKVR